MEVTTAVHILLDPALQSDPKYPSFAVSTQRVVAFAAEYRLLAFWPELCLDLAVTTTAKSRYQTILDSANQILENASKYVELDVTTYAQPM